MAEAAARRSPGPETTLTPQLQTSICAYVQAGATIPDACVASGIKWPTAKKWMERGRKGQAPYDEFVDALSRARASYRAALQLCITKQAKSDWRAAAWALDKLSDVKRARDEDAPKDPVVLLYPVQVAPGQRIDERTLLPGQSIDTTGETTATVDYGPSTETNDDDDE